MAAKKNSKYSSEALSALSVSELEDLIKEDEQQMTKMRFSDTVVFTEDASTVKDMRRNLARLKTALRAKQLAE